jgi:SHS2 domain-containing protein
MPYRFLEDVAIADVAFEAEGRVLPELFKEAALAVTNTMVQDLSRIEHKVAKRIKGAAENIEMLLFHFLQDLIFYKDADLLLFSDFQLTIVQREGEWHLHGTAYGEEISPDRHQLLVDVKAVSLHKYQVQKTAKGWRAVVILDV